MPKRLVFEVRKDDEWTMPQHEWNMQPLNMNETCLRRMMTEDDDMPDGIRILWLFFPFLPPCFHTNPKKNNGFHSPSLLSEINRVLISLLPHIKISFKSIPCSIKWRRTSRTFIATIPMIIGKKTIFVIFKRKM